MREVFSLRRFFSCSVVFCLSVLAANAQDTNLSETFDRKLREMKESFEKAQQDLKNNFEQKLREQREEIDALKRQLSQGGTNVPAAAVANTTAVQTNAAAA